MASTDSERTCAAASSIARGIPSSRVQMAPTDAALAGVSSNSGCTAAARSTNSRTASDAASASTVPASGIDSDGNGYAVSPTRCRGSRLDAMTVSPPAASSSRLTTRAHAASRCSQLSSTISRRRAATWLTMAVQQRATGLLGDAERGRDGLRHQRGLAQRRKFDEPDAVGIAVDRKLRDFERQAGLPDSADAREREQARGAQKPAAVRDFGFASDESCQLTREVVPAGRCGTGCFAVVTSSVSRYPCPATFSMACVPRILRRAEICTWRLPGSTTRPGQTLATRSSVAISLPALSTNASRRWNARERDVHGLTCREEAELPRLQFERPETV